MVLLVPRKKRCDFFIAIMGTSDANENTLIYSETKICVIGGLNFRAKA